jgi:hypothetical protein
MSNELKAMSDELVSGRVNLTPYAPVASLTLARYESVIGAGLSA